ncbi:MAG: hypothetical protein GC179_18755 [Anaerolineaceae bacterium]|nr:hypothetical protein [Anaerolineaceae bacterium]
MIQNVAALVHISSAVLREQDAERAKYAANAAKAAKTKVANVENDAVVANVVVENRSFLSHLQRLVVVKLRVIFVFR